MTSLSAEKPSTASTDLVRLRVTGMDCPSCATKIENVLKRVPGIHEVTVNVGTGCVAIRPGVENFSAEKAADAIRCLGYSVAAPQLRQRSGEQTMPPLADNPLNAAGWRWSLPFRIAVIVAIVVLAIDQLTKWLMVDVVMIPPRVIPVLPFLNLQLGFNTGISFSLFSESLAQAVWLVVALKFGIVLLLLWWASRVLKWSEGMSLGFVIGGALGNIADRLRLGGVVDFLDLYYGEWHWPTFNMADIAITSGVGILLISGFLVRHSDPRQT